MGEAMGKDLRGRRLGSRGRGADDETREALEPVGYDSPQITVERNRSDGGTDVVITVDPGEPVRVRDADIAIIGEGGRDRYLKQDLGKFQPDTGDVINHALYEAGKTRITRRLAERGYFDADFASHRVEVPRADNAAAIELLWHSEERRVGKEWGRP